MTRRNGILWVLAMCCIPLSGCAKVGQATETIELQHGLSERYPGTKVEVSWVNGLRHLQVSMDGPAFRELGDSTYRPTADSIARLALGYFPPSRDIDSITVSFVVESSGALVRTTLTVGTTFAATALR